MAQSGPIVGIDLGTTHSSVGFFDGQEPRIFPNVQGEVLTPSAVALDVETGKVIVGRPAKDVLALHPERGERSFKRWIGSARSAMLGSRRLSATELSAYVLDGLRSDAERALGRSVDRCVISVPAYFAEPQRLATRQAAQIAGFTVERLINEPTAAALAHGIESGHDEWRFMVFDLGGGTFDVCVMELFAGVLQVKGVAGESQLGGEDFTSALTELLCSRAGFSLATVRTEDAATLTRRAELLKRQLSRWQSAEVLVPTSKGDVGLTVTVEEADAVFRPLLARLAGPCRSALRAAGVQASDLDEILLVGGATRMPCVQRFVEETLGKRPTVQADPELTVARGAALHAAMCARDAALEERVITDLTSHSLGLAVATRVGAKLAKGRFLPLIERGNVLPTSRSERVSTLEHNQTLIRLEIFEGDAREVKENTLLGELMVRGIPAGPPRDVVDVTFTYDLSGILEVEARVLETEQVLSKVLTRDGRTLEGAAMEEAMARLARLKEDPSSRPAYRDLMAQANVLWSDLRGADRQVLEAEMLAFEAALSSRTPQLIEVSAHRLRGLCEALERGERL